MEKFCIFCGQHPTEKNKEHVISSWLIELTGTPNRTARFFVTSKDKVLEPREYAFDQFTFPACSMCNNGFHQLESRAAQVMRSLLGRKPLSSFDFSVLLDWLDKVRIGLWLGFLYLGRNPMGIRPQYHIVSRLGQYDRMVGIANVPGRKAGINFLGPESPCFQHSPTCFALLVNDLCLVNASGVALCSRRLGFPYPHVLSYQPDGSIEVTIKAGSQRVMRPVERGPGPIMPVMLYQPVFRGCLVRDQFRFHFDNEWVRSHSLDWDAGYGKIFMQKGDQVEEYPDHPSSKWQTDTNWNLRNAYARLQPFVLDRLLKNLQESANLSPKDLSMRLRRWIALYRRVHQAIVAQTRAMVFRNGFKDLS